MNLNSSNNKFWEDNNAFIGDSGSGGVIDAILSTTSTNAVQNKVITNAINPIRSDVSDLREDLLALEQEGYPMASIQEAVDVWADEHEAEIVNAYVTPEMFGAKGDGVTDDTISLQQTIDFAQNNGYAILISKNHITSTLHISKSLTLFGNGKLKAVPYAYTTLTSSIGAHATEITVQDSSKMHVNQTIIIGSGTYDLMVITGIDGNTISVEHSPLNNPTNGTNYAHNSGERVEILNTLLFMSKNIVYDSADIESDGTAGIKSVVIEGLELEGNTDGYQVEYYNAYEGFGGHLALFFRSEYCTVRNVRFHDGALMGICFLGYTNSNEIVGCIGYNFTGSHYGNSIDNDRKDSCSCITVHWDTGVISTNRDAYSVNLHNNKLCDSNVGIFLSAVHNSVISNNTIKNISVKGIMCYCGDPSYGFSENVVIGNTIQSEVSNAVALVIFGGSAVTSPNNVYANNELKSDIPLQMSGCYHSLITGNHFCGESNLIHFNASCGYTDIKGNYGELLKSSTTMLNFDGANFDNLLFSGNTWLGNGTSTQIANSVTKTGTVTFVRDTFLNSRYMRLVVDTLRVYFCTSQYTFFALTSEKLRADVFMLKDGAINYSSTKYLSGTTTERTALPSSNVLPVGYQFYDTTEKKLYIYDGNSNWIAT